MKLLVMAVNLTGPFLALLVTGYKKGVGHGR